MVQQCAGSARASRKKKKINSVCAKFCKPFLDKLLAKIQSATRSGVEKEDVKRIL